MKDIPFVNRHIAVTGRHIEIIKQLFTIITGIRPYLFVFLTKGAIVFTTLFGYAIHLIICLAIYLCGAIDNIRNILRPFLLVLMVVIAVFKVPRFSLFQERMVSLIQRLSVFLACAQRRYGTMHKRRVGSIDT